MQEATIADRVARMRNDAAMREAWEIAEDADLIERQQQVIDLLMKAVAPFKECIDRFDTAEVDDEEIRLILLGSDLTSKDLRRARDAKVEAERILSPREKTDD